MGAILLALNQGLRSYNYGVATGQEEFIKYGKDFLYNALGFGLVFLIMEFRGRQ